MLIFILNLTNHLTQIRVTDWRILFLATRIRSCRKRFLKSNQKTLMQTFLIHQNTSSLGLTSQLIRESNSLFLK